MNLSTESRQYINNTFSTVSHITKPCAFAMVQFCSTHFSDTIKDLCHELYVSRSGYYKWLGSLNRPNKYSTVIRHIRRYQEMCNYSAGYRKIAAYLRLRKLACLSDGVVYRLMKKYNLLSRCIRTARASTLKKEVSPYPNLLMRNFYSSRPNQKWCIDITQINAEDKKFYMCAIIDLYDRSIVAYQFADLQNKPLVKRTIRRAMEMLPDLSEKPIILHSDQGNVFSAKDYKRFLDIHNIVPSMSEPGTPYDNAVIESFFSCLKCECIYPMPKLMAKNMAAEIDRYIVFYNHYRIHMRYRNTPMNVRRCGLARQNCFNFGGHGSKRHKTA